MVSEKYGGQELGTVELAVLMEQLGYALTPGPILSTILAGIALEVGATDEQKERYLAPLADRRAARDDRALGRRRGMGARATSPSSPRPPTAATC